MKLLWRPDDPLADGRMAQGKSLQIICAFNYPTTPYRWSRNQTNGGHARNGLELIRDLYDVSLRTSSTLRERKSLAQWFSHCQFPPRTNWGRCFAFHWPSWPMRRMREHVGWKTIWVNLYQKRMIGSSKSKRLFANECRNNWTRLKIHWFRAPIFLLSAILVRDGTETVLSECVWGEEECHNEFTRQKICLVFGRFHYCYVRRYAQQPFSQFRLFRIELRASSTSGTL